MEAAWGIRASPGPGGSNTRRASTSSDSCIVVDQPEKVAIELSDAAVDDEYISFADEERKVRKILRELKRSQGQVVYKVRFADNHTEEVRRFPILVNPSS